ncbi:MAG: hypothetical protein K6G60_04145 [Lachnospiraceae bacterium]|nr:hypothetical protein [Lachnospiraceae bacterium]
MYETFSATCTKDRVDYYECDCGYSEKRVVSNTRLGHDYRIDNVYGATCTSTGSKVYKCSRCGDSYRESIPTSSHNMVLMHTVGSGCYSNKTGIYECTDCGHEEKRELPGTMTGHNMLPATCGEASRCSHCGYREGNPTGKHNYVSRVAISPTCTSQGQMEYTCSVCGDTYKRIIEKAPHDIELISVYEATCTHDRVEHYECDCGYYEKKEIPNTALGHDYIHEITSEATCTSDGYGKYTCSRCGASYGESIPRKGHSYKYVETVGTGCTENKKEIYECSECGHKDRREKADSYTGHDYLWEVIVEPTCTNMGKGRYTCSLCGDSYTEDIDVIPHALVLISTTEETCENNKIGHYRCECGYEEDKEIPNTAKHLDRVTHFRETCGSDAYDVHTCDRCGYSYQEIDNSHPATGKHKYSKVTCTKPEICSVCGQQGKDRLYNDEIDPDEDEILYHDLTCVVDEDGDYIHFLCKTCGEVFVRDDYKVKHHDVQCAGSFLTETWESYYDQSGNMLYHPVVCRTCGDGGMEHIQECSWVWNGHDDYLTGRDNLECKICVNNNVLLHGETLEAPTCDKVGSGRGTLNSGKTLYYEIPRTKHEWETIRESTCIYEGERKCLICGLHESVKKDPDNHKSLHEVYKDFDWQTHILDGEQCDDCNKINTFFVKESQEHGPYWVSQNNSKKHLLQCMKCFHVFSGDHTLNEDTIVDLYQIGTGNRLVIYAIAKCAVCGEEGVVVGELKLTKLVNSEELHGMIASALFDGVGIVLDVIGVGEICGLLRDIPKIVKCASEVNDVVGTALELKEMLTEIIPGIVDVAADSEDFRKIKDNLLNLHVDSKENLHTYPELVQKVVDGFNSKELKFEE